MDGTKGEVIQGFNDFLAEQRALPDSCRISVTKFNTVCTLLYPPISIVNASILGAHNYTPGGATALFDAIAETVHVAENHQQPGERVLCLIVTDGEENSSRETARQQVTDIIKAKESRGDWTFVYLGVTPEQFVQEMVLAGTRTASNTDKYEAANPARSWRQTSESASHFRGQSVMDSENFFRKKKQKESKRGIQQHNQEIDTSQIPC